MMRSSFIPRAALSFSVFASVLALSTPSTVSALDYSQVQADKSSLRFSYRQMGVAMEGRFKKFSSQLRFDPAQAHQGQAVIEVDLGSIDTGTAEADSEVAGKAWFNTKIFPTARFVSTGVKPLGTNRYEVSGTLSIKGKTLPVTIPATFTPQGNGAVFEGSFTLRRGDFSIGEGSWSAFDIVANDVQVKFRLTGLAK